MDNSFKIKKGLNIQPTDPTSVVNPEAGDIIVDSTDDNRLKLYNPDASEFETIAGSGGASGNLMPVLEKQTPTVSNVVAVEETTTILPVDDNKKSIKATFSSSNGFIRYEVPVSADLDGVQGVVRVWIKTALNNLSLNSTKGGVIQSSLSVNSSNKWRQYEIPVVLGDANYGFEVRATGSVSGDVFIDEGSLTVERVIQPISGAQFVGSGTRVTTNQSIATTADTKVQFNSATMHIGSFDTTTNYRFTPDRTGNYLVTYSLFTNNVTATNAVNLQVRKNGTLSPLCASFQKSNGIDPTPQLTCNVRIDSLSDYIEFFVSSSDSSYDVIASNITNFKIYYFPDSSSTIVTQNTELTAKTANEFVATVSDTGVVSGENFDWINGNCSFSINTYTCPVVSGVFDEAPVCVATVRSTNRVIVSSDATTKDSIVFSTRTATTDANISSAFRMKCTRSTDYRKHATIVGKFENINSSELVKVEAMDSAGQPLSANVTNITWSNEIEDNYNAWNGTTFTAPKSSYYNILLGLRSNANDLHTIVIYKNGSATLYRRQSPAMWIISSHFYQNVYLEAGDAITFRSAFTITTVSDSNYNYLSITELPDTESIIKNLSTQKTKCQTKFLNSNVTTTTADILDLKFQNLVVGKKYQITGGAAWGEPFINATLIGELSLTNGSEVVARSQSRVTTSSGSVGNSNSSGFVTSIFTATGTNLIASSNITNHRILGDGTRGRTHVQLCELPDTYVETTEW